MHTTYDVIGVLVPLYAYSLMPCVCIQAPVPSVFCEPSERCGARFDGWTMKRRKSEFRCICSMFDSAAARTLGDNSILPGGSGISAFSEYCFYRACTYERFPLSTGAL